MHLTLQPPLSDVVGHGGGGLRRRSHCLLVLLVFCLRVRSLKYKRPAPHYVDIDSRWSWSAGVFPSICDHFIM